LRSGKLRDIRIAAFGAHAGDMEITAGALLMKYSHHGASTMTIHALRPSGKWAKPPNLTVEQYAQQRYDQAFQVGKLLGTQIRFMGYKEGEPFESEDMISKVCGVLADFEPDIVLTHWKGSYHPDHILTFLNVNEGINRAKNNASTKGKPSPRVRGFFFPENWEDPQGFQHDIYVDVSDQLEAYIDAISLYDFTDGKYSGFDYIGYYRALARLRGIEARCKYAQVFMIPNEWATRRQVGEFLPL